MNHRPTNKRTVIFMLTVWFWFPWFIIQSLLIEIGSLGSRMVRLTDWMLDWLHTGCPACDSERSSQNTDLGRTDDFTEQVK